VELKKLFKSMIEAPGTNVRPSSRLPCLAFKKENVEQADPSSATDEHSGQSLGTYDGVPVQGPLPFHAAIVTPPSSEDEPMTDIQNGHQDNKSEETLNEESSMTAAHGSEHSDDNDDSGVDVEDKDRVQRPEPPKRRPPPPPPRPGEIPGWVKFAATQQDAAEVMDNMTHLLQCAALPEDIMNGDQPGNKVRR
jgi:hypothetical protein